MNEYDQSDVGYQTSGDEPKTRALNGKQFPGNKMPQGNKMQKKGVSKSQVQSMIKKSERNDKKEDLKLMRKHVKNMHTGKRHKEHR